MKSTILLLLTFMAFSASASQCEVKVVNEVKANDGWLMFRLDDGSDVEIDENNQVFLHGNELELSPEQVEAVKRYRNTVTQHLARVKLYAEENAQFFNNVIDDISASLGKPDAFAGLKSDLDRFWQNVGESYQAGTELVLPSGTLESLSDSWQKHFANAKEVFDETFLDQAWDAFSAKLKQEDGFSLTAMAQLLVDLEARISERLDSRSQQMDVQQGNMCESLHDIVEQEDNLREQIPELHDYRTFTI